MRSLIATLFVSLDGYTTGRDPEDMEWAIAYQGAETNQANLDAIRDTDLMLLGRQTYEIFAAFWPTATPEEEGEIAEAINATPRVVFSKTLAEPLAWQNTVVNRGDLATEIPKLKQQPGKDIGTAGSVALVRSLLRLGLLDRLRLQVYPVALGATGTKPVFEGFDRTTLELVASRVLDGQVVELDYQPRMTHE
ncbi:MAG: dihydrofolate reductase family protein [Natronosporangium sp.]